MSQTVAAIAATPASLAVSGSSARVAFPNNVVNFPVALVENIGANEAFLQVGGSSVVATTSPSGYLISLQPGAAVAIGIGQVDGTGAPVVSNLAAITASSTTTLRITQWSGAPTFGSAGAGTYNITTANLTNANIGLLDTTSTQIDPATSENQPTNSAIGATTAGQTGNLVMGATTTAAPTYTTGKTDPLSLTTAGALRTDGSATTQPVSAVALPLPTGAATAAAQATQITAEQAIAAALGTVADAAWSGTGDGTVIALLKKIALNTTPA